MSQFILSQRDLPFSYSEVGATRGVLPSGYTIDHNRVKLGTGANAFTSGVGALKNWRQFDLGWVAPCPTHTPLEAGAAVAILTKHFGFWSLNPCRVIYLIEEERRFGFAYGTLPDHVEQGEERFTIEWDRSDDSVWYDILAFSRPGTLLVWLSRPLARRLQKRFARDSMRAMVHQVSVDSDRA